MMKLQEIIAEMREYQPGSVPVTSVEIHGWADALERLAGTPIAEVGHEGKLFWLVASLHSDWPDGTKLYAAPPNAAVSTNEMNALRMLSVKDAEIERLKIERENTCLLCNRLEREVCAEGKVRLRAEIERLRDLLERAEPFAPDGRDIEGEPTLLGDQIRAALAGKDTKP